MAHSLIVATNQLTNLLKIRTQFGSLFDRDKLKCLIICHYMEKTDTCTNDNFNGEQE